MVSDRISIKSGRKDIEAMLDDSKQPMLPRDFEKFCEIRKSILDKAGLGYGNELPTEEIMKGSLGLKLYRALVPFYPSIWGTPLAYIFQPPQEFIDEIIENIDLAREDISDMIVETMYLLGIETSRVEMRSYQFLGEQFDELFHRLNGKKYHGMGGLIKNMRKSMDSTDLKLVSTVLNYLKEADPERRKGGTKGLRTTCMRKSVNHEFAYVIRQSDVMAFAVNRKRGNRIAEKIAYRAAIADQVLHDYHFNRKQFNKRAKFAAEHLNDKNPEKRRAAERWKHYHDVAKVKNPTRKFVELYKECIVDDIFRFKIIVKDIESIPQIISKLVQMKTPQSIYRMKGYRHRGKNHPYFRTNLYGYVLEGIDNHYENADKPDTTKRKTGLLVQLKLRREDENSPAESGHGGIVEIAIQDGRNLLYDTIAPEVGRFSSMVPQRVPKVSKDSRKTSSAP